MHVLYVAKIYCYNFLAGVELDFLIYYNMPDIVFCLEIAYVGFILRKGGNVDLEGIALYNILFSEDLNDNPYSEFACKYINPKCVSDMYIVMPDCKYHKLPSNSEASKLRKVQIKKEVDPNDKRVGTVTRVEGHKTLVEWDAHTRKWEYTVNLKDYVKPLAVGDKVYVEGQYLTSSHPFLQSATLRCKTGKIAVIHNTRIGVIWDDSDILEVVPTANVRHNDV